MPPFTEDERTRRHRVRRVIAWGWLGVAVLAMTVVSLIGVDGKWVLAVGGLAGILQRPIMGLTEALFPDPPTRCGTRIIFDKPLFRPSCDCGWTGPADTDRSRAVALARAHAPDVVLIEGEWKPRISME